MKKRTAGILTVLLFVIGIGASAYAKVYFLGNSGGDEFGTADEQSFDKGRENITDDNVYSQEDIDDNCDGRYQYCKLPKVGDGPSCGSGGYTGYTRCVCPASFDIDICPEDYEPDSEACDGKYQACKCKYTAVPKPETTSECTKWACNGSICLEWGCPGKYDKTCDGDYIPDGLSCGGKYTGCKCNITNIDCSYYPNRVCVRTNCDGAICTECACPVRYSNLCNGPGEEGVPGQGCTDDNGVTRYSQCRCRAGYNVCSSPKVGVGTACTTDGGQKYTSCECPGGYNQSCSGDYTGNGTACDGRYTDCKCKYEVKTCSESTQECKEFACGGQCIRCGTCDDTCEAHGLKPAGGTGCTFSETICGKSCYKCTAASNCGPEYKTLGEWFAIGPESSGCGGHYGFYYTLPEWRCPDDPNRFKYGCGVCGVGQGGHWRNDGQIMKEDSCAKEHGLIDYGRGRNDIIWLHNRCNWATN
jgi:hypothetical protein